MAADRLRTESSTQDALALKFSADYHAFKIFMHARDIDYIESYVYPTANSKLREVLAPGLLLPPEQRLAYIRGLELNLDSLMVESEILLQSPKIRVLETVYGRQISENSEFAIQKQQEYCSEAVADIKEHMMFLLTDESEGLIAHLQKNIANAASRFESSKMAALEKTTPEESLQAVMANLSQADMLVGINVDELVHYKNLLELFAFSLRNKIAEQQQKFAAPAAGQKEDFQIAAQERFESFKQKLQSIENREERLALVRNAVENINALQIQNPKEREQYSNLLSGLAKHLREAVDAAEDRLNRKVFSLPTIDERIERIKYKIRVIKKDPEALFSREMMSVDAQAHYFYLLNRALKTLENNIAKTPIAENELNLLKCLLEFRQQFILYIITVSAANILQKQGAYIMPMFAQKQQEQQLDAARALTVGSSKDTLDTSAHAHRTTLAF